MADSKKPNAVLSQLETDTQEPYVLGLSGGKRVTFPSPAELDAFEIDEFMSALNTPGQITKFFELWLSEEDYNKLRNEKGFTLGKMRKLMEDVNKHYEGVFGDLGEGNAS